MKEATISPFVNFIKQGTVEDSAWVQSQLFSYDVSLFEFRVVGEKLRTCQSNWFTISELR